MKKHYTTILIGATYYALGYAAAHESTLILEESQQVGGDFHAMLHPVDIKCAGEKEAESALGKMMRSHGVWTEKGFDLLKAAPVAHACAAQLLREGKEILLDCRIMDVRKEAEQCIVRYFCNEGICEAAADRVIDTTVNRITGNAKILSQTLNAFTVAQEPGFDERLKAVCPECVILDGFLENEKLMLFPADPDETILPAYQRMTDAWKKAFPEENEKILFVADVLDAVYEAEDMGSVPWNGGRFANPVSAFVKGGEAQ